MSWDARLSLESLATRVTLAGLLVVLSGCGFIRSGSNSPLGQYPTTTTPNVTLSTERSPVGPILSTGGGYTLYDFVPDTPTSSACTSATCVLLWPPLTVTSQPAVGKGLQETLVGTLHRADGSIQVTYGGHPLYTWNDDVRPGEVTGQGVVNEGGPWYVVSPSGKQVTTSFSVGGP